MTIVGGVGFAKKMRFAALFVLINLTAKNASSRARCRVIDGRLFEIDRQGDHNAYEWSAGLCCVIVARLPMRRKTVVEKPIVE